MASKIPHRATDPVRASARLAGGLRAGSRAAVLTLAAAALAACEAPVVDGGAWKTTIKGQPFTLTVSSSDPTRQRGLGGVTEIPVDGGMAFAFPDAQLRGFWMKDCVIDMDIVYLDPLGYVTAVHTMRKEPPRFEGEPQQYYEARLPRYSSLLPAQFAIELRAGRATELGIRTQDRLEVDLEVLRAAVR